MYGVISYWVGEYEPSKMWLYATEKEATEAMKRLWEQSRKCAMEDENFDAENTYCENGFAVVVWKDGLYRYFEVVKQSAKEEI